MLALSAASRVMACDDPPLPMIPSEEQVADRIGDILTDTREYRTAMVAYVACIRAELEAAGGESAQTLRARLLVRRHNLAVEEGRAVADLFAERVGPASLLSGEPVEVRWRRCISLRRIEAARILGDRALLFEGRGRNVYVNILETSCPELRSRTFSFDPRDISAGMTPDGLGLRVAETARICRGHRIYAIEPITHTGTPCRLGGFYSLSEAQAETLLAEPGKTIEIVTIR